MADLNFNDMSDPEKLRSELRRQFKGLDEEGINDLATDDRARHLMEFSEFVTTWAIKHTGILKAAGAKHESADVIQELMRGFAATLVGQLKKDPMTLAVGAKALVTIFDKIMVTTAIHAINLMMTDPRFKR